MRVLASLLLFLILSLPVLAENWYEVDMDGKKCTPLDAPLDLEKSAKFKLVSERTMEIPRTGKVLIVQLQELDSGNDLLAVNSGAGCQGYGKVLLGLELEVVGGITLESQFSNAFSEGCLALYGLFFEGKSKYFAEKLGYKMDRSAGKITYTSPDSSHLATVIPNESCQLSAKELNYSDALPEIDRVVMSYTNLPITQNIENRPANWKWWDGEAITAHEVVFEGSELGVTAYHRTFASSQRPDGW